MDLHDFRTEYLLGGLSRADLRDNPVEQFEVWLQQAMDAEIREPTAMVLATVDSDMQPSQRIVLLKQVGQQGFVFFTDSSSQKGQHLANTPRACVLFPWHMLERQVIVRGQVEQLSRERVDEYFQSRPHGSQLAAATSQQSQPIESRQVLEQRYQQTAEQHGESVPLPDRWSGYCLLPQEVEFWQGGEHRLHDRFRYTRESDGWVIDRLQP